MPELRACSLRGTVICTLLLALSLIPPSLYCASNRELSRAESRRLLTAVTKAANNPVLGCPDWLIAPLKEGGYEDDNSDGNTADIDGQSDRNHSYLVPFKESYANFLQTVITPLALHTSYRRDIVRSASLAEVIMNWLSLKGIMLVEGTSTNADFENFLRPLMRAFTQTSLLYPRKLGGGGNSGDFRELGKEGESTIQSVTFCARHEHLMYVEKSSSSSTSGGVPGNLCAVMTPILEGSTLKTISSTIQIFGVWAPLHCNPGATEAGKKIPLHLIIPIPHTKSVSLVFEFDLRNLTLDLCAAKLHYCRQSTTQCVYRQYQAWPFDVTNYICQCKSGFYTDRPENGYPAELYLSAMNQKIFGSGEGGGIGGVSKPKSGQTWGERMSCKVCPPDCPNCTSGAPCGVEYNLHLLRGIPVAMQAFFMTAALILGIFTLRLRRTRVLKASNWLFLEIFLLGAMLLYTTSVVMYFPASSSTCILLPWFREVGFALMYGVLIVKLYRVLICFQSRKAHRVHVRDKDLFKYLGCFVAIVTCYMMAWTAVTLDYTLFKDSAGIPISPSPTTSPTGALPVSHHTVLDDLLVKGRIRVAEKSPSREKAFSTSATTPECPTCRTNASVVMNRTEIKEVSGNKGQQMVPKMRDQYFRVCRAMSWDIVTELCEMAVLLIGVHYCRLIWSAPSEFNENRCITIALLVELVGSGTLYLTRHFLWYSTHPDIVYLIYFIRCHVTVTANIAIMFGLKFWYIRKPPSPQTAAIVVGAGGGRQGMVGAVPGTLAAPHIVPSNNKLRLATNGELDFRDVNLADMEPEVIRGELKRLYTAIEVYKTKAMRRDNPHISKRRGGRKQRRFSLQPFHKKHHGGSGVGESVSGYQGDVSTASYMGGIERSTAGGLVEEEPSKLSEGSLTSLVDTAEQNTVQNPSGKGRSRTNSERK